MTVGKSAVIEVLKHVRGRALKKFSFEWSRVGDDNLLPVETNKPNLLTLQSVNEEDLEYYKCEVKEAETVVLSLFRGLFGNEAKINGLYNQVCCLF